jgi:hypothetical protein
LEAELSCLFAKAHFGSLVCLFIATVEDGFCVRFLRQQDVIENPCDFMGGGCDGLGSAQLGSHAPKELAEVTFRAAEGVGAHPERSRGAMLYLACFTGQHLATADSFFRAEAKP